MLYTVVDEEEYSIYNHNRSIYYGKIIFGSWIINNKSLLL